MPPRAVKDVLQPRGERRAGRVEEGGGAAVAVGTARGGEAGGGRGGGGGEGGVEGEEGGAAGRDEERGFASVLWM